MNRLRPLYDIFRNNPVRTALLAGGLALTACTGNFTSDKEVVDCAQNEVDGLSTRPEQLGAFANQVFANCGGEETDFSFILDELTDMVEVRFDS